MASALGLLLGVVVGATWVAAAPSRVGIHLSDIHLDPFYGTGAAAGASSCRSPSAPWFGVPGCDTSPRMMHSAVNAAAMALRDSAANTNHTPVVYYTGDWLRHEMTSLDNPTHAGIEIVRNITSAFKAAFGPGITVIHHPVLPVSLGNEDFIPDYHFNVSNAGNVPFMRSIADELRSSGIFSNDSQADDFAFCGFAAHVIEPGVLRAVALNTLIYTIQMNPITNELDPCGQFAWLRKQLTVASNAGERVHLISHIPPALPFWKESYFRKYKQIIQDFAGVVDAQFYGHIHRFGYMASDSLPPLFLGGPVTRISHTAPDFTLMPFRGTQGSVVDDRVQWTFFNATQTWEPHASLRGVLGLSTLSPAALVNASVAMLRGNASTFDRFYALFEGGFATHSPSGLDQLAVSCFSLAFDWTDAFRECLGSVLGSFWGPDL